MRIHVLDKQTLGDDIDFSCFSRLGQLCIFENTQPHERVQNIQHADVVIVNKICLNGEVLRYAPHLKLICVAATGYDNIDLEYCRNHHIAVCNVVGYSTDSVAQVTVCTALSLITHFASFTAHTASGAYSEQGCANMLKPYYHEIVGKTWGVIGLGNIGRKVADIAFALGCKVLSFCRHADARYNTTDLETLCEKSDIISVHLPLTDDTRKLIDRRYIEKMKNNVIFINTARGAVTDETALCNALTSGKIGALGIDVFEMEPFPKTHPFYCIRQHPNVCFTPHMAWGSVEARKRCIDEITENIRAFLRGEQRNRIV